MIKGVYLIYLGRPEVHLLERSSFHGFLVGEWKGRKFQFPTDMETHDAHAFCCKALWYLVSIGFQHPHTILFPPWQFKEVTISQPIIMISTPKKQTKNVRLITETKTPLKLTNTTESKNLMEALGSTRWTTNRTPTLFSLGSISWRGARVVFSDTGSPKHRRHGQRTQELNFVDGSDVILNSQQANKNPSTNNKF